MNPPAPKLLRHPSGGAPGLAITVLLASLATSIVNVAMPNFTEAFGIGLSAAQWITLSYLLSVTLLMVAAGQLGDRFGRTRMLLVGVTIFSVASGLCAVAPNFGFLLAARFLQGAGGALMLALATASAGDQAGTGRAGRALGMLGTMSAAGTTLGPLLGGLMLGLAGWRGIFAVNLLLGVLAWALLRRDLAHREDAPAGARLPTLSAGSWEILQEGGMRARLLMTLLVAGVLMGTLVVGPFYLSQALLLSPAKVGLLLSVGPLVAALAGLPAGWLVDRVGAARVTIAGLLAIALGSLALSVLPVALGVGGFILPVVVMTAGYALFQTANNAAVMSRAVPERRGLVSGFLNLARNLGLMGGAALLAAVFARGAAGTGGPPDGIDSVVRGLHATFAVASVLVLAALGVAAWAVSRPRVQTNGTEEDIGPRLRDGATGPIPARP